MGGISGGVVAAVGGARVSIPSSLRKTINDIKEITGGKHSDDDIYAVLKECNMDPNEAAQRLLYIDTFHEVKRKRDKKKGIDQAPEGYRQVSGIQRQGARGDYGGRRHVTAPQENGGMNNRERKSRPSATVVNERENIKAPSKLKSSAAVINAAKNASNGGVSHETASHVANNSKFSSATETNLSSREPPLQEQISSSKAGPSAPTPINTSAYMPEIRYEGVVSASESGVYSSASDPILVPSLSPRNPGTVGTIKREKGAMGNAAEYISDPSEARQNVGQNSASETILSSSKTGPSIIPQDDQLAKQTCGPTEVLASQLNGSGLDHFTRELDRKVGKSSISVRRSVIFPDHLQVPEALQKALIFGSFDANLDQSANSENISMPTSENVSVTDLAVRELSESNHSASSTHREGENSSCPPSHLQVTENSSTPGDNTACGAASKYDQPKQDLLAPIGGSQYPLLQTSSEFDFGSPPVLGPHFMHQEGSEPQVGHSTTSASASSTPSVTQPSGLVQSSFAIPPHLLPFIRQPHPPNFIPYNPYFPHLYMPHNAQQFFGNGVLPQQPTPGNISAPPATAAGVKFPVSPLYKAGTIAGNLPHYGIPSGYGPYGVSTLGYSSIPAFTSSLGSSSGDLVASESKEKNMHSSLKQNDEPHAWTSAPGRDISPVQANYVYNIPPGQHFGFSPAHFGPGQFPGVYHLNHTLPPPPTIPSLPKQSQAATGSAAESVVPTSSSYQQPHSQINWNTQILNRENI